MEKPRSEKRLWEGLAALALLAPLAVVVGGIIRLKNLNDGFAAAIARGDAKAAFALLRQGADVRSGSGAPTVAGSDRQAIFLAVSSGDPAFVKLALNRGASLSVRRGDGHTALMAAAARPGPNQGEIIRLLIGHGADPNATDTDGFAALHWAVGSNDPSQAIRVLMGAGANIDNQDRMGRTALIVAAKLGRDDTVRDLLAQGADATLKNQAGNAALQVALRSPFRRKAVVALLRGALASRSLKDTKG